MTQGVSMAYSDQMLRDAAARTLAEAAPNAALAQDGEVCATFAESHWQLAAEMGWTGIMVPESHGGLGLCLAEAADIVEEMGAHLFCGPYALSAVLLPALAPHFGAVGDTLLRELAEGAVRLGLATTEAQSLSDGRSLLPLVEHAAGASHILRLEPGDAGQSFVLYRMGGATSQTLQPMDPTTPIASVVLAPDAEIARARCGHGEAERVLLPIHILTAVELVGIARAAFERAVAHVRQRKQFGEVIGRFQAIKHRLADGFTLLSHARLAVSDAVRRPGDLDATQIARVIAADAAMKITADCIQLHGGMGFSWETDAHFYLKRARRLHASFGGTAALRKRAGDRFIESLLTPERAVVSAAGVDGSEVVQCLSTR
ncbi:acyl-CoA dehydrogenase family protein [Bosea sp. (in: a-proteobacteria)]|jgi:alkylation response protein AidB-like acyl-CoA dehydrogenase|uniref:acyl-CoA dehydrogenase family protein n=1 Tax=Bosea sp. (in: a-proteobacteria) TaxID=1871050 RepID=UPI002DDCA1FC|nr:acyl-CoA dehydrogenase family protein [Bosea sp. (in: a-proteobacteria)]HEV2512073.1 acyl-CoA dehydrogenase family protein [Bosea sp. (in: a-proteobacteria)]